VKVIESFHLNCRRRIFGTLFVTPKFPHAQILHTSVWPDQERSKCRIRTRGKAARRHSRTPGHFTSLELSVDGRPADPAWSDLWRRQLGRPPHAGGCDQLQGRVSYIRISLCYFCFRWNTVSSVQALMHNVSYT